MYRRGIVEELDANTHRARVRLPERDDVVTGWLDVLVRSSLGDQDTALPPRGTQVAVMLDEHDESGCVLGALYSEADPPPVTDDKIRALHLRDGAKVEYDQGAHELRIVMPSGGDVSVNVSGGGLVKVAGAEAFVARADLTDARLAALQQKFDTHIHPTGVGPSGVPTSPVTPLDSVAATTVKVS